MGGAKSKYPRNEFGAERTKGGGEAAPAGILARPGLGAAPAAPGARPARGAPRAPQQVAWREDLAGLPHQQMEQVEFGGGQFDRFRPNGRPVPFDVELD